MISGRAVLLIALCGASAAAFWALRHDPRAAPAQRAPAAPTPTRPESGPAALVRTEPELATPVSEVAAPEGSRAALPRQASQRVEAPPREEFSGLRVLGRVVDPAGAPCPGARVHVREHEDPEFLIDDYERFEALIDVDDLGRFERELDRQGEFALYAVASGWGASEIVRVPVNPGQRTAEVELRLSERQAIEGVVLDEDMQPVSGVRVSAHVDVEGSGIELPGGITSVEYFGTPANRTDAKGNFRLVPKRGAGTPFVVNGTMSANDLRRDIARLRSEIAQGREPSSLPLGAEALGVIPGGRPVTLILRPVRELSGSLRLKLQTSDGGRLPHEFRYVLRRIGPNGGVYSERSARAATPPEGALHISGLRGGQRYEVVLKRGKTPEQTVGPFVAVPGEVTLETSLPGLHPATLRLTRPRGAKREALLVEVIEFGETGERVPLERGQLPAEADELQLDLPPGEFQLEVYGEVGNSWNMFRALARESIRMPPEAATFTIELR